MVFVNYGGGSYWFFAHSSWNGLTVADLVFPWFMFIMGTSMALSFESLCRKAVPLRSILYKIIRRSLILFSLGLFVVNQSSSWASIRIPGVLQRFAVAYLVVGLLRACTATTAASIRDAAAARTRLRALGMLEEVVRYWADWVLMAALVGLQLSLTFFLPVPGCPTGYLGPGGVGDAGNFSNCTGGAARWIDHLVLGDSHIYQHPTSIRLYNTGVPYDPEGILGCLNSILVVFLGLQAGQIFLVYESLWGRLRRLAGWGSLYGALAALLTNCTQNEGWIPVNKNLWSLSFVLALASMAHVAIILLYVAVDVAGLWGGEPFSFVGMNSILVYVGHELASGKVPWGWSDGAGSHHVDLAVNLVGTSLWVLTAYYLHYIRYYLSI